MLINPYVNVDWSNDEKILSVTHQHLAHSMTGFTPQSAFDIIYNTGVRHYCISRYRPAIPSYPFDYENLKFVYVANPFKTTENYEEIVENYSFEVNIPDDVIGSPNAEHVYPYIYVNGRWNQWSTVHINAVGSLYASGTNKDDQKTWSNDSGLFIKYTEAYDNMLENLQYSDAGGLIINHLNFTENNKHSGCPYDLMRFVMDSLDYDSRVLGTDMLEGGSQGSLENNAARIDTILLTGRRCWIFCQGDWARERGRNVLIIPSTSTKEEKEYECLKAYRNGNFYSRYSHLSGFDIQSISYSNNVFSITTIGADGIIIIVDGVEHKYSGNSASYTVPSSAIYVRAVVYVDKDDDPTWEYNENGLDVYKDVIFTNPIMVNAQTYQYNPAYDDRSEPSPDPDPEPDPDIYNPTTKRLLYWS